MKKLGWLIGAAVLVVGFSGASYAGDDCYMSTSAQSTPPVVVMTTPPAQPAADDTKNG